MSGSVQRDGFGTLLKLRAEETKAEITAVVTAAVAEVQQAVDDTRSEIITQVAEVRNDVLDAIEQAASGGGISLGKYNESFTAAPVWIVNHNLGRPVTVRVSGAGGQEIVTEVIYVSDTQARVFFDVPTAGSVSVT